MNIMNKTPLNDLGNRIMIIGPSNAGKSTLCHMLGQKLGFPSYHLDQIQHIPNTNWETRPKEDFTKDHDKLIKQNNWVMDGNYSSSMPQRINRATSIIWINPHLTGCIWRYILRCMKGKKNRFGGLKGAKKEFSFALIHYTLTQYPKKNKRYQELMKTHKDDTPFIKINSMRELNEYYEFWQTNRFNY